MKKVRLVGGTNDGVLLDCISEFSIVTGLLEITLKNSITETEVYKSYGENDSEFIYKYYH